MHPKSVYTTNFHDTNLNHYELLLVLKHLAKCEQMSAEIAISV